MADKTIKLVCANCHIEFEKSLKEVKRQKKKGRTDFFCGRSCGGVASNSFKITPKITKECPVCHEQFDTKSGAKEANFCSRSCASKGSVTENRRSRAKTTYETNDIHGTIQRTQSLLKKREAWKYAKVKQLLESLDVHYEFECIIGDYIYDLVLFDIGIVVEFDGSSHRVGMDEDKTTVVVQDGWTLHRLPVENNTVIDANKILSLLYPTSKIVGR